MAKIILTSREELTEILSELVSSIKQALSSQTNVPSTTETFLNLAEAADYLNLAKQTIYGFTSKNLIPFHKRGKKLYFMKSDLEMWLIQGKKKTISEMNDDIEREV